MKKFLLFFLPALIAFFLGALTHEADIQRNCAEKGRAGYSGWLGDFTCGPVLEDMRK